jgi:hypothetical protein
MNRPGITRQNKARQIFKKKLAVSKVTGTMRHLAKNCLIQSYTQVF